MSKDDKNKKEELSPEELQAKLKEAEAAIEAKDGELAKAAEKITELQQQVDDAGSNDESEDLANSRANVTRLTQELEDEKKANEKVIEEHEQLTKDNKKLKQQLKMISQDHTLLKSKFTKLASESPGRKNFEHSDEKVKVELINEHQAAFHCEGFHWVEPPTKIHPETKKESPRQRSFMLPKDIYDKFAGVDGKNQKFRLVD